MFSLQNQEIAFKEKADGKSFLLTLAAKKVPCEFLYFDRFNVFYFLSITAH